MGEVKPTAFDAKRCIELRKRSKMGQQLNEDESAFCADMWMKYPEWYRATDERVFNGDES